MVVIEVAQQEKVYVLYCKPDQNTMAEGIIGPMKKFNVAVFLNGHCVQLFNSLCLFL